MPAEREIGVDAVLERRQALLLETRDLVLGERLVGEVGQRRAAPEGERRSQALRGGARVAALLCGAALGRQPLEAVDVELIGAQLERVTAAASDERALAERLPQPRDVDLHRLRRGFRLALAPELVDDAIDRDDLAAMNEQDREHRALPGATERHLSPFGKYVKRAKNADLHASPTANLPPSGQAFTSLQPRSAVRLPRGRRLFREGSQWTIPSMEEIT